MAKFVKATRKQLKLRMALSGPSGTGKTWSALKIAHYFGGKVALVDTEHRSAEKYAGSVYDQTGAKFDFDVMELDNFALETYIDAIKSAEAEGYSTLIIDSLSHAWFGVGGALDQADSVARKSQSKNTFAAWKQVTPLQNKLIETINSSDMHIIATMRTKTEYSMEKDEKGKTAPKKIGTQPIQREGMEYEFDVVCNLTLDLDMIVEKTRCPALSGKLFNKAGKEVAEILMKWLDEGDVPVAKPLPPPVQESVQQPAQPPADAIPHLDKIAAATTETDLAACVQGLKGAASDVRAACQSAYKEAKDRIKASAQEAPPQ